MGKLLLSAIVMTMLTGCATEFMEDEDPISQEETQGEFRQVEPEQSVKVAGVELEKEFDSMPVTRAPSVAKKKIKKAKRVQQ